MSKLPSVESLIPHRGRWKIIDHLIAVDDLSATAIGRFGVDDVEGHFPDQPVVPGVVLLEGLAQTMCCLSAILEPEVEGTPFLAGFEKVRFRAPVLPPAEVEFRIVVKERRMGLTMASGTVLVEGKRVANARLTGAILPVPSE